MEREVSRYNDWIYKEYLDRRNKMTSWIKKRWYVEDVNTLGIEIEEDMDIEEIDIVSV
ncbi:hypothetical protein [Bacillus sp. OTU530]|uniref:hypothetical protein n=1 Tax=Bacillus sp. OTU530 TaxID=3043862 RepID=UPI00313E52FF